MKKLLLSALLLVVGNTFYAMDAPIGSPLRVTLPSQQELHSRLCCLGLNDFAEKTQFHINMANKEKHPAKFVSCLDRAVGQYYDTVESLPLVKGSRFPRLEAMVIVQKSKPKIIREFLRDHQQAIQYLERKNILMLE